MRRVEPRRAATTSRDRGPSAPSGRRCPRRRRRGSRAAKRGRARASSIASGSSGPPGRRRALVAATTTSFAAAPGAAGGRGAGEQRAVEVRRDGALLRREVDVARAHGEAVRLAQRGHAGDLDRQVEVAHEAADDGELLRVLLAEEQHVRLHHAEQLGDDDGDAVEVARARGALEALGERAADVDVGGEALRVHLVGRRREDDRDARLLQEAQVAGLVARVPRRSPRRGRTASGSRRRRRRRSRSATAPPRPG